MGQKLLFDIVHDDISLKWFVVPGLTRATEGRRSERNEGAHPVFSWIPAFTGITPFTVTDVAVYQPNIPRFHYSNIPKGVLCLRRFDIFFSKS